MFRVSFCCDVCIPALCKRHLEVQYQYLSFSRLRPKPHSPLLIFLLACATGSADRKPFAWSGRLISNFLVLKEDNYFLHTSSILPPYFLHTSSFTCSHKFQVTRHRSFSIIFHPSSSKIHYSHECNQRGTELFLCPLHLDFNFVLNEVTTSSWSLDCM